MVLPDLIIGDLKVKPPIIQGGMGVGVSLSGLASAVANEGGIGVISATGIGMHETDFEADFMGANKRILKVEIEKAKKMSNGIIGVNLMVALSDYYDLFEVSFDMGVDVVFLGAGLPLKIPAGLTVEKLKSGVTKCIPIVSSARAANIIFKTWAKNYNHVPDAVVVEGPLAGGHLGFKPEQIADPNYSLENILPEVVEVIKKYEETFNKKIPVIAGGGIFTGEDIFKIMQLGASGVQMGTRFVATDECDASEKFKNAYIESSDEDMIIIKSPVGLPGRAINNKFLSDIAAGKKQDFVCPCKCLHTCDFINAPYCIALALTNAKQGLLDDGFVFAGTNAPRVDRIISVKELMNTLQEEYSQAASQG
ncbi:NAD(P)H-dependent flavin oxidoreductase [Elusimicrobiota bacterium]